MTGSLSLVFCLLWTTVGRAEEDPLLVVAARARASVVRIVWRDERFSDFKVSRNAIAVRADGLLLMGGPPPRRTGTLTARFSDGAELRAQVLGRDTETALTLLRVERTNMPVLQFRRDPRRDATAKDAAAEDAAAGGKQAEEQAPLGTRPAPAGPPPRRRPGDAQPPAAPPTGGPIETGASPLRVSTLLRAALPPLGLRVVMVSGEGAVAMGPIRAHGRHGTVTPLSGRRKVMTTGLVGVALAALDRDVGSPLLDAEGRVAGILVGRRAAIVPADAAAAARRGLRQRATTVEAVAVPARIAEMIWPLLQRHKRVPRLALGIRTVPVEADLSEHLRLSAGGHVVTRLAPAGMAERHGMKVHDVIVSIEQRPIARGSSMHDVLLPFRPGALVHIEVIRKGKRLVLSIRTGQR